MQIPEDRTLHINLFLVNNSRPLRIILTPETDLLCFKIFISFPCYSAFEHVSFVYKKEDAHITYTLQNVFIRNFRVCSRQHVKPVTIATQNIYQSQNVVLFTWD